MVELLGIDSDFESVVQMWLNSDFLDGHFLRSVFSSVPSLEAKSTNADSTALRTCAKLRDFAVLAFAVGEKAPKMTAKSDKPRPSPVA